MTDAIPFIISDENLNTYGFWIKTDGIDLSDFQRNPVMLYDHDRYNKLPIGLWSDLKKTDNKLTATADFDTDDEFANSVKSKVEKGIIKGASIGADIIEMSNDPKLMKPGQTRPTVTKCKIYEVSVTPFPANKNAFKLTYKGREINLADHGDLSTILPLINNTSQMKEVAKKLGLSDEATEQQCVDAIDVMSRKASDLSAKLSATFVKLGEAIGVITDKNRDRMIKLANTDFDLALSFLEKPETSQAQPDTGTNKPQNEDPIRLSDLIKELSGKPTADNEKNYDWYQKNDPVTLARIRVTEPEKFKKLIEDFYGKQNPE